jgi:hypothetical protein
VNARLLRAVAAVAVGFALAATPSPAAAQAKKASPEELTQAKKHMEAGAAFYNDPTGHKCEEAYREFKKAFELSGSAKAVRAMGVCALELERDGDAILHLEKFLELKDEKIPAADVAQAESDLKALRSAVAWVTLSSDRSNVRITDTRTPSKGYPVTNRYVASAAERTLGVHPGLHVFTASSDGAPDLVWKVEVANGAKLKYFFAFDAGKPVTADGFDEPPKPAAPPVMERPVPVSVYVLGGLTVALAVPTTIFMLQAKGAKDDFDAANGVKSAQELEPLRDDVTSSNLLADVFLGAAAASAVTTGILFLTRPEVPAEGGEATQESARVSWQLGASPAGPSGRVAIRF